MNNREILFRGFHEDKNGKETIYIDGREIKGFWVYGYYELFNDTAHINSESDRLNSGGYKIREFVEVIPETVGQFTGLTDKNDKRIFEGDIIEVEDFSRGCALNFEQPKSRWIVYWNEEEAKYQIDYMTRLSYDFAECEVIGNIFSNPELLRSEDK